MISLITIKNSNLTKNDFYLDIASLSYTEVRIIATNSSKFFGSTKIFFNGKIDADIAYDSEVQRVDAYSSTQYDGDSETFYPHIGLGKAAFLKSFDKININYNKWAYNNHHGQVFEDEASSSSLELSLSGGSVVLYEKQYIGSVNWIKLESNISYSWSGDSLEITLNTWVESFASGWNAYWASAEARTKITSVTFS